MPLVDMILTYKRHLPLEVSIEKYPTFIYLFIYSFIYIFIIYLFIYYFYLFIYLFTFFHHIIKNTEILIILQLLRNLK